MVADGAADKIGFDGLCIHIKIERYKKGRLKSRIGFSDGLSQNAIMTL